MSAIERLTITLPSQMAARLKSTVAQGEYASASEIVREALRDWTRERDAELNDLQSLREAIRIGDESGPSIPSKEVFAELRQIIADRKAAQA